MERETEILNRTHRENNLITAAWIIDGDDRPPKLSTTTISHSLSIITLFWRVLENASLFRCNEYNELLHSIAAWFYNCMAHFYNNCHPGMWGKGWLLVANMHHFTHNRRSALLQTNTAFLALLTCTCLINDHKAKDSPGYLCSWNFKFIHFSMELTG